jgi:hypothetical protein
VNGKRLREWDEREEKRKKKKDKETYYIYWELGLFILGYTIESGWGGFKNLNLYSIHDIYLLDFLIYYHS